MSHPRPHPSISLSPLTTATGLHVAIYCILKNLKRLKIVKSSFMKFSSPEKSSHETCFLVSEVDTSACDKRKRFCLCGFFQSNSGRLFWGEDALVSGGMSTRWLDWNSLRSAHKMFAWVRVPCVEFCYILCVALLASSDLFISSVTGSCTNNI